MDCTKCTLDGCPRIDKGFGSTDAELIIVGEAPGATEIKQGVPFVGRSGQMLNKLLSEINIARNDIYITNSTLCWPQPHRAPSAEETRHCFPRLLDELKSLPNRKVVLALGRVASRVLMGVTSITADRGKVIWHNDLGCYVICTYHPAAVLRNINLYREVQTDFAKVARALSGQSLLDTPLIKAVIVDDLSTINGKLFAGAFLDRLREIKDVIALDIENDSQGHILCIGQSWSKDSAVIVTQKALQDPCFKQEYSQVLESKRLVLHYGVSDLHKMWAEGFSQKIKLYNDTMFLSYMLNETLYKEKTRRGKNGLKYLAQDELNVPDWMPKEIKDNYATMENCDPEMLYEYNAHDCAYTKALYELYIDRLDDAEIRILNNIMVPAANALNKMTYIGAHVDVPYLDVLAADTAVELADIKQQMYELAGREFNPNSPTQLVKLLYTDLDIIMPGGTSTDKDHLEIIKDEHPIVPALMRYRELKQEHGLYIAGFQKRIDKLDRLHTELNVTTTVTGRLSSSNPNLQNVKRGGKMRNLFVASPGSILIEGDEAQAEVRMWAAIAHDPVLRDACMSTDMHSVTGSLMYRIPIDQVSKAIRQAAKTLTFGIIYLMSAETLAGKIGVGVQQAEEMMRAFLEAYKIGRQWIEDTKEQAVRTGIVYSPYGRKRRFPYVTGENRNRIMRQAVNFPIQSGASDVTMLALARIQSRIDAGELGNTRAVLTVHDSILLETFEENYLRVAYAVKEEMEQPVLDNFIPFKADVKAGDSWGTAQEIDWDKEYVL